MKHLILAALVAAPLTAMAAASDPDASFYKALAEGGVAEVADGKLAESRAADPKIKDFAAMMVKDHSAANQELKTLAISKGMKVPSHKSMSQQAKKSELDVLTGGAFDKAYVKSQITAHQDTIALLQKEISTGQDPDAKAFAQKILPTVQSHLTAINGIASGMGITN